MKNLLSFNNFTDHVKTEETNKMNEESAKYRNKMAKAFENLLSELGVSRLSEVDEAMKKKMWETLFNDSEMNRLSGDTVNETN
jgi:hypothetical protein